MDEIFSDSCVEIVVSLDSASLKVSAISETSASFAAASVSSSKLELSALKLSSSELSAAIAIVSSNSAAETVLPVILVQVSTQSSMLNICFFLFIAKSSLDYFCTDFSLSCLYQRCNEKQQKEQGIFPLTESYKNIKIKPEKNKSRS